MKGQDEVQGFIEKILPQIESSTGVIVLITWTSGSTARKPGARMLVLPDGTTIGTIGGGWLENEATKTAVGFLASTDKTAFLKRYELTEGSENSPMICGGEIELLFQKSD